MKFDSYITSSTKIALTVKNYTEFVNKTDFNKKRFSLKKAAFTLAETLITLTIIGVIAALTIPSLISEYQKHTYVVGLKKAYSQLQNAVKMIPITQGCPAGDFDCVGWYEGYHRDENGQWVSDVTNIEGQEFNGDPYNKQAYLLSKQFKASKICLLSDSNDYKNDECKNIESIISKNNWIAHVEKPRFFINNDAAIWMRFTTSIGVDINGIKGPNKLGRDQFVFKITDQYYENRYGIPQGTVIPVGSKLYVDMYNCPTCYWRNNNYCTTENANKGNWQAEFCTGRVLEEDAMNY